MDSKRLLDEVESRREGQRELAAQCDYAAAKLTALTAERDRLARRVELYQWLADAVDEQLTDLLIAVGANENGETLITQARTELPALLDRLAEAVTPVFVMGDGWRQSSDVQAAHTWAERLRGGG